MQQTKSILDSDWLFSFLFLVICNIDKLSFTRSIFLGITVFVVMKQVQKGMKLCVKPAAVATHLSPVEMESSLTNQTV